MVFILFSAFGPEFSSADFASKHGLHKLSIWEMGQPRRSGQLHEDSGISVSLQNAETTIEVVPLVEQFLEDNQAWIAALSAEPVARLLHLGVTVGEENSYAPSFEFDLHFLALLVDQEMELHVTAYPTSDATE